MEMLDTSTLDVVVALWPDAESLDGTAIWLIKGSDLIENQKRPKRHSVVAFWLRNEACADDLVDEITCCIHESTTIRGEFLPIGGDLQFECVPTADAADAMYVVKGGLRIARRGRPGTRERKRWMSLIPTFRVRDITPKQIEVWDGKAMLTIASLQ
jgi:hypothetical protein